MSVPSGATAPSSITSAPITQLTFFEKMDLIPGLLSLLGTALYQALSGPFRGQSGSHRYKHHITHALVRKLGLRFSTAQLQYIGTPFVKVYEQWCQKQHLRPNIVTLKSGIKGFWVGDPQAEYVVIYYHGGGFSLDGGPEHLGFWGANVFPELKAAGKSVSFFFLEYTLVPHATYPTQTRQAIEAVEYITKDLKRSASTILLAGDSAGGNLSLGVLSQVMHPSPDLPKLEIDKPFKAFILVAPWVALNLAGGSTESNKDKDIIHATTGTKWASDYMAGKSTSPYAEALVADASWWKHSQVEHILCTAGSDELLVDAVSAWVEKYKSANGSDSTTFVVGKNEIHIAPIIEPILGDPTPTAQGDAIKSWMKARL